MSTNVKRWYIALIACALLLHIASHFDSNEFVDKERSVPEIITQDSRENRATNDVPSSIRVCTQNLHRLASQDFFETNETRLQLSSLVKRMKDANCDIIGVQELVGGSESESRRVLEYLGKALSKARGLSGDAYDAIVSRSNDRYIRNGFLVRRDLFSIDRVEHWNLENLPALSRERYPYRFSRGPLAVTLTMANGLRLFVVNDHFKSKTGAFKDHTNTSYEVLRLMSAAAVHKKLRRYEADPEVVEIFLGDRNTGSDGASAQVLSGKLRYEDFGPGRGCRISERGNSECPAAVEDASRIRWKERGMLPLLEHAREYGGKALYTYKRGRSKSILDEIYMSREDLWRAQDVLGRLTVGVEGEFKKGSDHLLAWTGVQTGREK